jgi:hypothetical protein
MQLNGIAAGFALVGCILYLITLCSLHAPQRRAKPSAAVDRSLEQDCSLQFVAYESSPWEQRWAANANKYSATKASLCAQAAADNYLHEIFAKGASSTGEHCGHTSKYLAKHPEVFSRFIYRDPCTGTNFTSYIEPLVSILQHPKALCYPDHVKSRDHLVLGATSESCVIYGKSTLQDFEPIVNLKIFDLSARYAVTCSLLLRTFDSFDVCACSCAEQLLLKSFGSRASAVACRQTEAA